MTRQPSNSTDWGEFNVVIIITLQSRISFYVRKNIYVNIWGFYNTEGCVNTPLERS